MTSKNKFTIKTELKNAPKLKRENQKPKPETKNGVSTFASESPF